jgi:FkbM family methyltransferase
MGKFQIRQLIWHLSNNLSNPIYRKRYRTLKLLSWPNPYSFQTCYEEILVNDAYLFSSDSENPYIIDCGANFGLSIFRFKELFPQAEILAFEPDPKIFGMLKRNIEILGYENVLIENKAVWTCEKKLQFIQEGGLSGKIMRNTGDEGNAPLIEVAAVPLSSFLTRHVDFLKIDVEGVETELIESCESQLKYVDRLFVEYHSYYREEQNLDRLLAVLNRAKFRYQIKDAFSVKHPFINGINGNKTMRTRIFDLQLDIFAYR